jgi:putative DNA methylase
MTRVHRKLIEVAMPLEAINREAAREKSIRHGHPSTLHLYWARRPLAVCRAVIFAQYVDDPSSYIDDQAEADRERQRLLNLIERLVPWEASTDEDVLNEARLEIARSIERSHGGPPLGDAPAPEEVNAYLADHAPQFHDPFCGGGSLPLEAQRLGLRASGSDMNPISVLVTKALIEIPPRFANMPPVNPRDRDKPGPDVASKPSKRRKRKGAEAAQP